MSEQEKQDMQAENEGTPQDGAAGTSEQGQATEAEQGPKAKPANGQEQGQESEPEPKQVTVPLNIFLASNSPRRKKLLEDAGVSFSVFTPTDPVDESLEPDDLLDPEGAVKKLAERKAGAVVQELLAMNPVGMGVIIGADTTVVLDGKMYGKPYSADNAREMLRSLSRRTHQVITGVSVWLLMLGEATAEEEGKVSLAFRSFTETSHVTFKELSEADINAYVATGETIDKAGAYGIQGRGAALVERYEGDYNNIVGLPVDTLLKNFPDLLRTEVEVIVRES